MSDIYQFSAQDILGQTRSLNDFRSQVLLVVNVASKCTLTPQYASLEKLYQKYHPQGFSILGFPCDQFGHQEPGDNQTIQQFCSLKYQVTFPMFSKIDVNGPNAHPIFQFLEANAPGWFGIQRIHWNFTKFLVNRQGLVIKRFGPGFPPSLIDSAIQNALES